MGANRIRSPGLPQGRKFDSFTFRQFTNERQRPCGTGAHLFFGVIPIQKYQEITELEAAWIAGFIDGDGAIMLAKVGKRFRRPLVAADSADLEILEFLSEKVGGTIIKKTRAKDHHRQAYTWRLAGVGKIIGLLKRIEGHMKCDFKKQRARIIITRWNEVTPRNGFYDDLMMSRKIKFEEDFLALGVGRGRRSYTE